MSSNYKEMYELNYLRNWAMFIGILIVSLSFGRVFKNTASQVSQQPVQQSRAPQQKRQ